jgi:hypothetical protein
MAVQEHLHLALSISIKKTGLKKNSQSDRLGHRSTDPAEIDRLTHA